MWWMYLPNVVRGIALLTVVVFLGMGPGARPADDNLNNPPANYHPDVSFTLKTYTSAKGVTFLGVGDAIDGVDNPTLRAPLGAAVQITLIDGDGAEYDVAIPDFDNNSSRIMNKDGSAVTMFRADKTGTFPYFCDLQGHRLAGMEGKLVVGNAAASP